MVKQTIRFFILLFIAGFIDTTAQTMQVYASTDTTDYVVGDYIRYSIEVRYDKDVNVYFPPVQDSIKVLEFIKADAPIIQESETEILEIRNYIFSKYDSSGVTIPALPVEYTVGTDPQRGMIETNPVIISVHTLEVDPTKDILDVKRPVKIPLNLVLILILALLGLGLLIGVFFIYRYYKNKKEGHLPQKIIVKIPPHKTALKNLQILEDKKLWQQGEVKEYHSAVTGIIRKYFEERFLFRALEMTSAEIMDELKNIHESQKVFDVTLGFLDNADLVKFAKFQPMPSVNEEMMKQAYDIVLETKPVEVIEEKTEVIDAE
ncbi:hypothetical protein ACFLTH_08640 [Bacteroidota bacterium]